MFSRSQTPSDGRAELPARTAQPSDAPPSIISVDMKVTGTLVTDGDVQIDGVIDGDVRSQTLSVGRTAQINGEIVAEVVRIWGRVNGRVRGKDVALMETAEINGDILHETLEVARGAVVEGVVKRQTAEVLLAAPKLVVTDRSKPDAAADDAADRSDAAGSD